MLRGTERVAHVVQAVEAGHQVVPVARELLRTGDLEAHPIGDPGLGGALARLVDRAVVVVGADERRGREGLRHQHRAGAVPTADVGHPGALLELGLGAVEGGDPLGHQVGEIARAEELLAAVEDLLVVLVPAHTRAGAVGLLHPWHGGQSAQCELEGAGEEERAVGVGEGERLLLRHRVAVAVRVVLDVAAGRLAADPLGHVARVGAGPLGELAGGGGRGGEAAIEAEAVAEDDVAGRHGRAQVADELADELHQQVVVDRHGVNPFQRWMLGCGAASVAGLATCLHQRGRTLRGTRAGRASAAGRQR